MADLMQNKCRYFAEFQVFLDFEQECKSNLDFITFMLSSFERVSQQLANEIGIRTQDKAALKSPLSRQVREQLLNYAAILNGSFVGKIRQVFSTRAGELKSLMDRLGDFKEANKEQLVTSQSYYDFYATKLKTNTSRMDGVAKELRDIHREQTVKTREFQVKGKDLGKIEFFRLQSKKDILDFKISNLEKENKRFRSDAHIETERLSSSYDHLTSQLIRELKKSEDRVVDIVSCLLQDIDQCVKPLGRGSCQDQRPDTDRSDENPSSKRNSPCFGAMSPIYEDTNGTQQQAVMPSFPLAKRASSEQFDIMLEVSDLRV